MGSAGRNRFWSRDWLLQRHSYDVLFVHLEEANERHKRYVDIMGNFAGVMAGFDFVLPPKPLVGLFEQRATPARQLLTNLLQQNSSLRRTRDLLLPRLLSGDCIRAHER